MSSSNTSKLIGLASELKTFQTTVRYVSLAGLAYVAYCYSQKGMLSQNKQYLLGGIVAGNVGYAYYLSSQINANGGGPVTTMQVLTSGMDSMF